MRSLWAAWASWLSLTIPASTVRLFSFETRIVGSIYATLNAIFARCLRIVSIKCLLFGLFDFPESSIFGREKLKRFATARLSVRSWIVFHFCAIATFRARSKAYKVAYFAFCSSSLLLGSRRNRLKFDPEAFKTFFTGLLPIKTSAKGSSLRRVEIFRPEI